MNFHETKYGANFFSNQLPQLIRNIGRLADALEKRQPLAAPPSQLCRVCVKYNAGDFHANCADCLNNGFCGFKHI